MSFNPESFDPGSFDPGSFDFGDGGGAPSFTPASVLVRAFRAIFYANAYQAVGSTFAITSPFHFTPYGMVMVGTPPSDWNQHLASYSPTVNNGLLRFPGRDETRIPNRQLQVDPEEGNPYD